LFLQYYQREDLKILLSILDKNYKEADSLQAANNTSTNAIDISNKMREFNFAFSQLAYFNEHGEFNRD